MKLTITREEFVLLKIALQDAVAWELSLMDAFRDKYSDEWKPMKTWEATYNKAECLHDKFKALRKKLLAIKTAEREKGGEL